MYTRNYANLYALLYLDMQIYINRINEMLWMSKENCLNLRKSLSLSENIIYFFHSPICKWCFIDVIDTFGENTHGVVGYYGISNMYCTVYENVTYDFYDVHISCSKKNSLTRAVWSQEWTQKLYVLIYDINLIFPEDGITDPMHLENLGDSC